MQLLQNADKNSKLSVRILLKCLKIIFHFYYACIVNFDFNTYLSTVVLRQKK